MSPESSPSGLPPAFTHLTGRLLSGHDVSTAVHQLARAAHQMVPTAAEVEISLLDENGTGNTIASTHTAGETADAWQHKLKGGPCLDAWRTGQVQRVDDTSSDPRWSRWQAAAAEAGIGSVLSAPPGLSRPPSGGVDGLRHRPGRFRRT